MGAGEVGYQNGSLTPSLCSCYWSSEKRHAKLWRNSISNGAIVEFALLSHIQYYYIIYTRRWVLRLAECPEFNWLCGCCLCFRSARPAGRTGTCNEDATNTKQEILSGRQAKQTRSFYQSRRGNNHFSVFFFCRNLTEFCEEKKREKTFFTNNNNPCFLIPLQIGADGRRSQIFLALSTASEFRDHLSTFSDFYASLGILFFSRSLIIFFGIWVWIVCIISLCLCCRPTKSRQRAGRRKTQVRDDVEG